jgi:6-hydroxynicotinate 3-monooxygenase
MREAAPVIAIIGAGIGGLAVAALLHRAGFPVALYEQAGSFQRIGAGIQQSPNAVKVLRALGIEQSIRAVAYAPDAINHRDAYSGALMYERKIGAFIERKYAAPHLLLHRGDLHAALATCVPDSCLHLGRRLESLSETDGRMQLGFADGSIAQADLVIGADGVHSRVRDLVFGKTTARFTGRVAWRTVFPAHLLPDPAVAETTKWWGRDRHIVIYFTKPDRSELYFVTSTPEPDFAVESWSAKGDMAQLREAYADFHPDVRAVLAACPEAHKWAILERDPLPSWSTDRVTLLGDACHPMTPYMAQGAATALEDAMILARCLEDSPDGALRRYQATRHARASLIQSASGQNDLDNFKAIAETVYGYDARSVDLAAA